MAEDPGQERTEEPTSKRLEDAKKKGQIARSKELNTAVILIAGSSAVLLLGHQIAEGLWLIMRRQLNVSREEMFDPAAPINQLYSIIKDCLGLIAPFILIMVIAAIAASVALGGWMFSPEAITPKFEKLDPIKGIKRIFAVRGLIEMLKSMLKFLLIFGATIGLFVQYFDDFLALNAKPLTIAFGHTAELVSFSFLILSATLILVVAIDAPFQLWDHKRKLKMTRQEIKDEMKDTDGKPEVKSRIRSMQIEMAQARMMDEVPKADVIVTNPTHFAVALKYDQHTSAAPTVVAKGKDLVASKIRSIAQGSEIPILSAPPLARALFYAAKVGDEIPEGLYLAVAQVLAYVFQLKVAIRKRGVYPIPPKDLPIPDEFKQNNLTFS